MDEELIFIEQLITKAIEGVQTKFEFIGSFYEFLLTKKYYKAVKKIAEGFLDTSITIPDADKIKDYEELLQTCINYYLTEAMIVKEILAEFKAYFWRGHFLKMLLGGRRSVRDFVDYRTLPISLF